MVERKIREEFARALEERDGDVINRILSSIDEESADELLKDVWNTSTGKEYGGNAGSAFDEFKERIYGKRRNSGLSRTIAWISSAAAVIAIALCLFLALKPNHSVTRWAEMTTGYGKMDSLVLQDGTKIWTNAGTTLIYPEKFDGKERHVYVSGEAFFSVAKDPKHPFIVTAEGGERQGTGHEVQRESLQ
jgi:ferric-dicitrate binding protein FerR (iron transport regulator)